MSNSAKKAASGGNKDILRSYHGRHLQKNSLAHGYADKASDPLGRKWKESEITQRGEKIMDLMSRK